MVDTKYGPSNGLPPSYDATLRYWFSSGVSKFSNAMNSAPVVGLTVGFEPWLSRQLPPAGAAVPTQNEPEPLITFGGDHERPWSSEELTLICEYWFPSDKSVQ